MSENILREIVRREIERLKGAGIPSPGLEAQLLAARYLGMSREEVILYFDDEVSYEARMKIESLTGRRIAGEPMAYIRGVKEFWSLAFRVDKRVMIPRPDTEMLVERCVKHAGEAADTGCLLAADVGTGSGAVACAIAHEMRRAVVIGVDVSADAVGLANENVEALGMADRIRLVRGDLLSPFRRDGSFDIIAANLPYIPASGIRYLPEEIRDYEPRVALDGGEDGLDVIRRLLYDAHRYIGRGGLVALEVEDTQVDAVTAMMNEKSAYRRIGVDVDMAGFKRVVWAKRR